MESNRGISAFYNQFGPKNGSTKEEVTLVLNEKDNYINKLNHELNELRVENEKLKDKLIFYELENLEKTAGQNFKNNTHGRGFSQAYFSGNTHQTLADTRNMSNFTKPSNNTGY